MLEITLLDGSKLEFDKPVTGYEVAEKISKSLAKASYAVFVNNELWDLTREITESSSVQLITAKNTDVVLPLLRHDMAHLLAEAVLELYPNTKLAVGPSTETGFFYDLDPEHPFKEEDLEKIENRMKEIIDRNEAVERRVVKTSEALKEAEANGEIYKADILREITDEYVTFYKQGILDDLCRGPHTYKTGMVPKSFKLTKVSGVYWKGDKDAPALQRIYAVGFMNDKDLQSHLTLQEELEKNDHRKIGPQMGLFHLQEEAAGSVFWHKKGWKLFRNLEVYIRQKLEQADYEEVKTPQIMDQSFWERSGHWEKFQENMFIINNADKGLFGLKPMNCPAHIQIFNQETKSYKDLPLRMAEFGCCHRNEPSGSLHGIMRVRAFTQDDAHIFCTEDQIIEETKKFCKLLQSVYSEVLGIENVLVKFSDRPEKRAGDDEVWDKSEKALYSASKQAGLDPVINKGEGAFYGPKLEFTIKDSLGRDWQLGTLQVDFVLPERLDANYIAEDGNKYRPVMLHRAILGSFERFIGITIEHYKGRFPLWLAPVQAVVATISEKADDYAQSLSEELELNGISSELDIRAKKINYKIREHELQKTPVIIIIGEKEKEANMVSLRVHGIKDNIVLSKEDAIKMLKINIENRNIDFNTNCI